MRDLPVRLSELWGARELLQQLVGKELKVRYERSALGFLWSVLTPVLMTVVFTVVFQYVIRLRIEDFPAFFLSGYLVWSFFQNSVQGSIQAVTSNGSLIRKVYFPREVLPLSIVLAQGVHFVGVLVVISPYLVWARGTGVLLRLPVVAFGVVLVTLFASGLAMLFAAANVSFRDLQEFIVVIFLLWFYATPVFYPYEFAVSSVTAVGQVFARLIALNPMTWFVRLFRTSLYGVGRFGSGGSLPPSTPSPELLAGTTAIALATFLVGYLAFHRFAVTFAKEV